MAKHISPDILAEGIKAGLLKLIDPNALPQLQTKVNNLTNAVSVLSDDVLNNSQQIPEKVDKGGDTMDGTLTAPSFDLYNNASGKTGTLLILDNGNLYLGKFDSSGTNLNFFTIIR